MKEYFLLMNFIRNQNFLKAENIKFFKKKKT